MSDRYLRRREVEVETGLSCATIYRRMATGDFPRPRDLGPGCVRWTESDVQEWKSKHSRRLPRHEPARGR
jgi:prophage regulatory protein